MGHARRKRSLKFAQNDAFSQIFFDDYSSILIVGSTLKSSAHALRISRAKLAFIIHAVGVNLPSICPVSSWVGQPAAALPPAAAPPAGAAAAHGGGPSVPPPDTPVPPRPAPPCHGRALVSLFQNYWMRDRPCA